MSWYFIVLNEFMERLRKRLFLVGALVVIPLFVHSVVYGVIQSESYTSNSQYDISDLLKIEANSVLILKAHRPYYLHDTDAEFSPGSFTDTEIYQKVIAPGVTSPRIRLQGVAAPPKTAPKLSASYPGLVGYWPLDNAANSITADLAGSARGTFQSFTLTVPGFLGRAIQLNGTSQYVFLTDFADRNRFTISAWVKPSNLIGTKYIFEKLEAADTDGYALLLNADKVMVRVGTGTSSGTVSVNVPVTVLSTTLYNHIAATYNGTSVKIYVNGVEQTSLTTTGTIANYTFNTGTTVANIGTRGYSKPGTYFTGSIDEVAFFSRALPAEEIAHLAGLKYQKGVYESSVLDGEISSPNWDRIVLETEGVKSGAQFSAAPVLSTLANLKGTDVGDYDGDGALDVFFVSGNYVYYVKNDGYGNFGSPVQIAAASSFSGLSDIALSDIDRDGDLDVVAAGGSYFAYYQNNNGLFSVPTYSSPSSSGAESIVAANFDGDIYPDVAVSYSTGSKIVLFKNNGSSWTPTDVVLSGFGSPKRLVAADMDNDGDTDIVAASGATGGSGKVTYFKNDGSGGGWTPASVSIAGSPFDGAFGVDAADVDGDGWLDVVATSSTSGSVYLWKSTAGIFGTGPLLISTTFPGASEVAFADIDGDGDKDVVAASNTDHKVTWWENVNGSINPATPRDIAGPSSPTGVLTNAFTITVGDFNGKGFVDVVAGNNAASGKIVHYRNGFYGRSIVDASYTKAYRVFTGDFTGDGYPDLIGSTMETATNGPPTPFYLSSWVNDGSGNFTGRTEFSMSSNFRDIRYGEIFDFTLDGYPDFAATSEQDTGVGWWVKSAASNAVFGTLNRSSVTNLRGLDAADLDGDGYPEMVVSGVSYVRVYHNASGAFATGDIWAIDAAASLYGIAIGDMDNDSKPDIVYSNTSTISIYKNPANPASNPWSKIQMITGRTGIETNMKLVDLDQDGDLDILVASTVKNQIYWLQNNGTGVAGAVPTTGWLEFTISGAAYSPVDTLPSDIDGDGDLDVVGTSTTGEIHCWYQTSAGEFSPKHTIASNLTGASGLAVADLNGDGYQDIAVACKDLSSIYVYFQKPHAEINLQFRAGTAAPPSTFYRGPVFNQTLQTSSSSIGSGGGIHSTLDGLKYGQYKIELIRNDLTLSPELKSVRVDYRPGTYSTLKPYATSINTASFSYLTSVLETLGVPNPSGTAVKYALSPDSGSAWYYYNGSGWVPSNGTYTQANTASELTPSVMGSLENAWFTDGKVTATSFGTLKSRAFLHTADGNATPQLNQLDINYEKVNSANLTYPNGAEILRAGSTVPVTWSINGTGGIMALSDIQLQYSPDGSWLSPTTVQTGLAASSGTGSWSIPSNFSLSSAARLRFKSAAHPTVQDASNSNFAIESLDITSPVGAEQWQAGKKKNITWSASAGLPANSLKIEYSTDGGINYNPIAANVSPSVGTYEWTVLPLASNLMKIKITCTGNGVSDQFFSESPANFKVASLQVTSPALNDSYSANTTVPIRWNHDSVIPNVKILYSVDGGANFSADPVIAGSTPNDGVFDWIALPLNSNTVIRVQGEGTDYDQFYADSAVFEIPRVLYIGALGPYVVGDQVMVPFENELDHPLTIEYFSNNGTSWSTIAQGVTGTSVDWLVPDEPGNGHLIKITSEWSGASVTSLNFSIKARFTFTTPASSDVFAEKQLPVPVVTGAVNSAKVFNAKVEYATEADNYATWSTIAANAAVNNGAINVSWDPFENILLSGGPNPNPPSPMQNPANGSRQVKVRITDLTHTGGAQAVDSSPAFKVKWHLITYEVYSGDGGLLGGLSLDDGFNPQMPAGSFYPSNSKRYYPNEFISATWSRQGYFPKVVNFLADSDKTVIVVLESESPLPFEVKFTGYYDADTDMVQAKVFLTKTGQLIKDGLLGPATMTVYNGSQVMYTDTMQAPNSEGAYEFPAFGAVQNNFVDQDANNFADANSYFVRLTVNYAGADKQGAGVLIVEPKSTDTGNTSVLTNTEEILNRIGASTDDELQATLFGRSASQNQLLQTVNTNTVLAANAATGAQSAANDAKTASEAVSQAVGSAGDTALNNTLFGKLNATNQNTQDVLTALGSPTDLPTDPTVQGRINEMRQSLTDLGTDVNRQGASVTQRALDVAPGAQARIGFRTESGLTPTATIYAPDNSVVATGVPMIEIGSTGIYEMLWTAPATEGEYNVIIQETTFGSVDSMIVRVGISDATKTLNKIGDISDAAGSPTLFGKLGNIQLKTDTIQWTDMDEVKTSIGAVMNEIGTGNIAAIKTKTDLIDWNDVDSLVLASGEIKTKTDTINWADVTALKTKTDTINWADVTGIKAKTDEINWVDVTDARDNALAAKTSADAAKDAAVLVMNEIGTGNIAAIKTKTDTIDWNDVDSLVLASGEIKAKTDTIDWADVAAIKTKTDTINWVNVTDIQAAVDALAFDSASIQAIKTKTDTIDWNDVTGLVTGQGEIKAKTDAIDWNDVTAVKTKTDTIDWADVTALKTKTDTINWADVTGIKAKTDTIDWADMATVRANVTSLMNEVGTGNIAAIKTKTDTINWNDIAGVVTRTGQIQAKTDSINWADVTAIKTQTDLMVWQDVEDIKDDMDTLSVNMAAIDAISTTLQTVPWNQVTALVTTTGEIKAKTDAVNWADIAEIKTATGSIKWADVTAVKAATDTIRWEDVTGIKLKVEALEGGSGGGSTAVGDANLATAAARETEKKVDTVKLQLDGMYEKLVEIQKKSLGVSAVAGGSSAETLPAVETVQQDLSSTKEEISAMAEKYQVDIRPLMEESKSQTSDLKELKNDVLRMKAVLDAIKKSVGTNKPVVQQWMESGSIILKALAINPSQEEEQEVPVRAYLPVEAKPEDILNKEDVELQYDPAKELYYVEKVITLQPGETYTMMVHIEDVWLVPDEQLNALRTRVENAMKIAETKPEVMVMAKILFNNVKSTLDVIDSRQKNDTELPQQHIANYRMNVKMLEDSTKDLDSLEQLVAQRSVLSGSTQGGVSALISTSQTWKLMLGIIAFLGLVSAASFILWSQQLKDLIKPKEINILPPEERHSA